jgi:F-type H+-transporting ATPase subunit epsilon
MKFKLDIVTPERLVYSEDVDVVTIPTIEGEIGILANHTPIVSVIASGELKIKKDGEVNYIAISGGFVQFMKNKATILADAAERAEEIDMNRAEKARERAKKLLSEKQIDKIAQADALAALQRSLIRIRVAQRHSTKKRDLKPQ